MRRAGLVFCVAAFLVTSASGHHKRGHHIPPGHIQRMDVPQLAVQVPPPTTELRSVQVDVDWTHYINTSYGYEVDLPLGLFQPGEGRGDNLVFYEREGAAELEIYGAENPRRLSPREFLSAVEQSGRIAEVTYRSVGTNWFVISGYYRRDSTPDEKMIFYAKFMFSYDRSRLSAFEITYSSDQRQIFDPIVERVEDSFTSPLG